MDSIGLLLISCDLEKPIAGFSCIDPDEFETSYLNASRACEEDGSVEQAAVYRYLAAISGLHFRPENLTEPFGNQMGFADGSRSMIGSDLDSDTAVGLKKAMRRVANLALKTRIADLIWCCDVRDTECAQLARDGYTNLVRSLIDGTGSERFHDPDPTGVTAEDYLRRAASIARTLGWQRKENEQLKFLMTDVVKLAILKRVMAVARIGNLAFDARIEDASTLLESLPSIVDELVISQRFHDAERIQEIVIRKEKIAKNIEAARLASLKLSTIFETISDASTSAMLKSHHLQRAIENLHGIKGVRDERQRLHDRLKEAQLHMIDELGTIEHVTDLTDEVHRLLSGYHTLTFFDAIRRLALTELPKDPDRLFGQAREEAQRHPLSTMFSTVILDQRGRTTARTEGGGESAIRHKVIQHQQISAGLAVGAAINPTRQMLTENLVVNEQVFFEICLLSPFVPSGMEHTFARGMHAFYYGDDFNAAICLVPMLEAGMRNMVERAGQTGTKMHAEGIESAIGLGPMLSEYRDILDEVFSPSIIFGIDNLFSHELGPKIRHRICHGLTLDGDHDTSLFVYATKLIFSLVILPLAGRDWEAIKLHLENRLGAAAPAGNCQVNIVTS